MHLTTTLFSLTLTTTTTLAVPLSPNAAISHAADLSNGHPAPLANVHSDILTNSQQCPASKSKHCCTSLNRPLHEVLGSEGLGSALPYLAAINVMSRVGLACSPMDPSSPDATCGSSIMCCSAASSGDRQLLNICQPVDLAHASPSAASSEAAYSNVPLATPSVDNGFAPATSAAVPTPNVNADVHAFYESIMNSASAEKAGATPVPGS